jgi:hypothetical protein
MELTDESIEAVGAAFRHLPPPVIVFCKSHSGSRLLARLMMAGGIWLGDNRNESEDSADLLRVVEPVVKRHYPDFSNLFSKGDPEITKIAHEVFSNHIASLPIGKPWGWKLCETGYALPFLHRIFPDAFFIHLLRDGRDVAFCDHVAPVEDFWRKIYFGTADIAIWRGRRLTWKAYRRAAHVYNAQHWVKSVSVGRAFGSMLGSRYIEMRYEDIVADPFGQTKDLFGRLGLQLDENAVLECTATVHKASVGKYVTMPWYRRFQSRTVLSPTLEEFGYGLEDGNPPSRLSRLSALLHAS